MSGSWSAIIESECEQATYLSELTKSHCYLANIFANARNEFYAPWAYVTNKKASKIPREFP